MHQNNSSEFYLNHNWTPNYDIFTYSGWALKDKIKTKDQILDIGCGYNLFKEHFGSRIYGIDPYNIKADQLITWEDYKLHKEFNVFFILGSFNFGDENYVESQIAKLSNDTKTGDRIYWRQNPGIYRIENKEVNLYPWTLDKNKEWANKYNFTINELLEDTGDRIYAEWTRN
tara:strand:- start:94 stop:609 length:516 start_codon:yes stop_codon:yes gene_type:complete